ncbi:MAG: orotate phosphoribosyltransferase [Acidobacteria bacterium]|nr:orotate phosphoribosyltransferase [Acidobacteriota bacterium]
MSKVLDLLKQTGAVITGSHFVLTSGKHASVYINKDALYTHTAAVSAVCQEFAERVKHLDVDTVAGPALGGIILSQWTAHHLSRLKGKEILAVYSEKGPEGGQIFTRGYDQFVSGKNVLVVEDLTTTGGSVRKLVDAIRRAAGNVAAVCVMVNRNPEEVNDAYFGAPFFALDTFKVEAYEEPDCPMCRSDVPVNTSVGHGREFVEGKD